MTDSNTPHDTDPVWQRNLGALRTVDADLADRLASVPLPAEAVPATGRDGSPTFKLRTPDGERWLGHTSMPTVSGPALLTNFDPGEGNVLLAGIGQGIEARLLAERLGSDRAVFVLEREPAMLALALRVHDVSRVLEEGRLVLIVGDDVGEALVRFLVDHEGYLTPERMVGWPWLDQAQTDEASLMVQRSGGEVARRRSAAMADRVGKLQEIYADRRPLPDSPRTLVICPLVEPRSCRLARDILTGLGELDWPADAWLGDSPRSAHPLALARRIVEFRPDVVVLIDTVRAGFGQVLPASMPVASWITPWVRFGPTLADGVGPDDEAFAMTGAVMGRLADAGLDRARARWLPPSVPALPAGLDDRDRAAEHDVVAVVDASPLSPDAHALTLESHQAVWKIARRWIEEHVESYTDDQIERVLQQAESASGARFGDASSREAFGDRINTVLGQTLVRQAVLEAVQRAGVNLAVWGQGWQDHPSLGSVWQGPVPAGDRSAIYASAKVVLHIDVTGNVTAELLTMAAAGAAVVVRAHPSDSGADGLAALLGPGQELLTFKRHSELIGHLKHLLGDASARCALADRARAAVAERHTMAHRLETLRSVIAQAAPDAR